jgi:hypothetical protein
MFEAIDRRGLFRRPGLLQRARQRRREARARKAEMRSMKR